MSGGSQAQSGGIDRISGLPDALILHILSYLPTGDKIRTGALSRRWKDLWTGVPKVYFNWGYGEDAGDGCLAEGEFVKYVNKTLVLLLLSGSKVKDFGVKLPYRKAYRSDVDVWTRFAATNETQKFELDFEPTEGLIECYKLPQHLYTNSFFRELRLCNCDFIIRGSVSWNSLKKLTISYGDFSNEALEKIVAGAPALEFLDLCLDAGISRLHFGNSGLKKLILHIPHWDYDDEGEIEAAFEISAPNVQSLELSGCFLTCKLVDMASLIEATLFGLHQESDSVYPIVTREVLHSLLNVQTLTLGTWVIQGIATLPENDGRPLFPKCKCLTIDTHLWKKDPSAIARLLKRTPQIETLMVTMSELDSKRKFLHGSHSGNDIDLYWASQEMASNCLTHLRTVKFSGFWTYRTVAIPFVQFLLKNARGLLKVIINLETKDIFNEIAPRELFEASQKLLSFPRSSPDAQLLVYL